MLLCGSGFQSVVPQGAVEPSQTEAETMGKKPATFYSVLNCNHGQWPSKLRDPTVKKVWRPLPYGTVFKYEPSGFDLVLMFLFVLAFLICVWTG